MASEKVTSILEEIKGLSVIELFDLEKAIEEEFGVSAAAVAVSADRVHSYAQELRRFQDGRYQGS